MAGLTDQGLLTSDQLINDYLNYLETFTWNIRRREQGYDLIFVDELHLFGEQERLVSNYLARSAEQYPHHVSWRWTRVSLQPRCSPISPLRQYPRATVAQADLDLGQVAAVDLRAVYRFSPEILSLIQHIHLSYPALELGPDWYRCCVY